MNILYVTFLLCIQKLYAIKAAEPEVCIEALGCVEGVNVAGLEGQQYEAFYGIPYAQPPIGELRFKNPLPVEHWQHKLMVKEPKPECIQFNVIAPTPYMSGEEDCLYLNVYRPKNPTADKLPILFYIHGGGLFSGSINPLFHGPEYFMQTNEIILVLPAYRLGPFGFLSSGDEHIAGNYGLKDQSMALKWVHQHINAFGGDPSRVTISGHSAGSVSAHLHMFSPASKDLFRNAILMSGVGNSPFARLTIDQRAVVDKLATAAGITNAEKMPSNELAAALRTVPAMDLVKAGGSLKVWDVHPFVNFRPNLEDESWPEPFMTRNLFQLTRSVNMPQTVPWIGGSMLSTGEGTVMALKLVSDPVLQAEFNKNFDEHFTLVLELNGTKNTEKLDEIIERLVAEYMGGVRELNKDTMDGFLALLGDAYFTHPLYRTIAADLNSGAGAAHSLTGALQFVYRGPYTFSQFFTGSSKDYGAVHVDDMLYLFGMPLLIPNGLPKSSAEYEIMKKYVGLYVEYAKNGNVEIFTKIGPCTIESFERSDGSGICDYLSIANGTEPFKVEHTWNVARMQLWDYVDKTLF